MQPAKEKEISEWSIYEGSIRVTDICTRINIIELYLILKIDVYILSISE